MLWERWILGWVKAIFLLNNLVELLKLVTDDLGSHWIADTVSIDENVIWEGTFVVVSECLEGTLKVLLEHTWADNLLALLALGTRLGVVLAHVLVVCGAEADNTLFTFMANIDSDKHSFVWDFGTKAEAPEVTTKLSVDLS